MALLIQSVIIALAALSGLAFGFDNEGPSAGFNRLELALFAASTFFMPWAFTRAQSAFWFFPGKERFARPTLRRFSFHPWEPLRFLYLFGLLSLSFGVFACISELIVGIIKTSEIDISFPLPFAMIGTGLLLGLYYWIPRLEDRLEPPITDQSH